MYRVIYNERIQGDHYIWTHSFDKCLDNYSLDQPEQAKDTECSIMEEYKVIHNEGVQGDHYFRNNVFGHKSFFNI